MPYRDGLVTDLLLTCDENYPYAYHCKKLICKLRELYSKDEANIFYKEYSNK